MVSGARKIDGKITCCKRVKMWIQISSAHRNLGQG